MTGWAAGLHVGRVIAVPLIVAGMAAAVAAQSAPPTITFFGVLRADDSLLGPSATDPSGIPVYDRPFGSSFSLVVEAARGSAPLDRTAFNDLGCPGLQIQATRPLGNATSAVCDTVPPDDGGVPPLNPPDLSDNPSNCATFNDFGCRFVDGSNNPQARNCGEGCILFSTGEFGCASDNAEVQFCGRIARSVEFPAGDTLVTARVRDTAGTLSTPAQLIVRVPFPTPTAPPSATDDDDSCAIRPGSSSRPALLLLLAPLLLWWLRRTGRREP